MNVKKMQKTKILVIFLCLIVLSFLFSGNIAKQTANAKTQIVNTASTMSQPVNMMEDESNLMLSPRAAYYFLEISIVSKSWWTWTIKVSNTSAKEISFEYNAKMCFSSDAQNWTGLSDLKTNVVAAGGSVNINISENAFADFITICWLDQGTRVITCANQLNTNKTLSVLNIVKPNS